MGTKHGDPTYVPRYEHWLADQRKPRLPTLSLPKWRRVLDRRCSIRYFLFLALLIVKSLYLYTVADLGPFEGEVRSLERRTG